MLNLVGVLYDPLQNPCPNALIRFTSLNTEEVLVGVSAEYTTTSTGSYEFSVAHGTYRLEVLYSNEYHEAGNVLIDEHTPDNISLPELVHFSAPYAPPLLGSPDFEWNALFQSVIDNDVWDREAESQVRAEDTVTNSEKTIHKSDEAKLAKETLTAEVGNTSGVNQILSYEDDFGRAATVRKTELNTVSGSIVQAQEIYTTSTDTLSQNLSATTGTNGALKQEDKTTNTQTESTKELTFGSNSVTDTSTLTDVDYAREGIAKAGNNQTYTKKYVNAEDLVQSFIEQGIVVENVEAFDKLKVSASGSVRDIQVDELNVGNTFSVNTKSNEVSIRGRLNVANAEELKGEVGDSQFYEYSYASPEELAINFWHIDDPDDLYDVPANSTIYRRHRLVTIRSGVTTKSEWSTPYLLTGADGAEGDTLYFVFKYRATDELTDPTVENPAGWSDKLEDGMLYRIERLVSNGVFQGVWSVPARIAGADGDDGEIVFEEYQYSPFGTSTPDNDTQGHWHTNFTTGDFFRSTRLIKYPAGTPIPIPLGTLPTVQTAWSDPVLLVPRKGFEYSDGVDGYNQNTATIYQRADSEPAPPTDTLTYTYATGKLTGGSLGDWSETPPSGSDDLWVAVATLISRDGTDTVDGNEWAVTLSGSVGFQARSLILYRSSSSRPALPTTSAVYTFSTGELLFGSGFDGWSMDPPENTAGTMWFTSATALKKTTIDVDTIFETEWATPQVLARNGVDGGPGDHGSGSYIVEWESGFNGGFGYPSVTSIQDVPTEISIEFWFIQVANRSSQVSDILTFQQATDPAGSEKRTYIRKTAGWVRFTSVIDGDQLVRGTVAAQALQSGTVLTDVLYVSSATNRRELTLSGSGDSSNSLGRLWAGGTNFANSMFSVDRFGNMKATNAAITGAVTATSGSFTGTVNATSGTFRGNIEAASLTFTGSIPATIDNSNVDVQGPVDTAVSGALPGINASIDTKIDAAIPGINATTDSKISNAIYPDQSNIQIQGNYQVGVSGWAIDRTGRAEFNNVTVRGRIEALGGVFGGTEVVAQGETPFFDLQVLPGSSLRNAANVSSSRLTVYGTGTEVATGVDADDRADIFAGLLLDTGYVSTDHLINLNQYILTVSIGGVWVFHTLFESSSRVGIIPELFAMVPLNDENDFGDAIMMARLHFISRYALPIPGSTVQWKLTKILLNE